MNTAKSFSELRKDDAGLYVRRNLVNGDELLRWARDNGVPNLVSADELHVTNVYSRKTIELEPLTNTVVVSGGARSIEPLGDKGAVVLMLESYALSERWREASKAGATWDYATGYRPHVTLTYDAGGVDLSALTPPDFDIVLGPEMHEPINDDWAEEKGFRMSKMFLELYTKQEHNTGSVKLRLPISKLDEDQNLVFGFASIVDDGAGNLVFDSQGDAITPDELEKAAHEFVMSYRDAGEMHERVGVGDCVESVVLTKEKRAAMGIPAGPCGWFVGFKVSPEIMKKVKAGEYTMFSIGGAGVRTPITEV